jgi:hypothetical protein
MVTNMATIRNLPVISCNFIAVELCTYGNCVQDQVIHLCNLFVNLQFFLASHLVRQNLLKRTKIDDERANTYD